MLNCVNLYHDMMAYYESRYRKKERKRIRGEFYLEKDHVTGALILGSQGSRTKYVLEQRPGPLYQRYKRVTIPKEQVSFTPHIRITPNEVRFLEIPSQRVLTALSRFIAVSVRSLRGKKQQGMVVHVRTPWKWGRDDTPLITGTGNGKFSLTPTAVVFDKPILTRTFNKEKQLELNRLIIRVRRALRTRTKLGAFKDLTLDELSKNPTVKRITENYYISPVAVFFQCLTQVDVKNIESFYPMLFVSVRGSFKYYDRDSTAINWTNVFNLGVQRNKEHLLKYTGAMVYC